MASIRILQILAFGIILSLCYLRINNDQVGVQNKEGLFYEISAFMFVGLLNAIGMCMHLHPFFSRFLILIRSPHKQSPHNEMYSIANEQTVFTPHPLSF
jgi:hypothetical protein